MSPARAVLLFYALLAGAFLLPSPSLAAGPVSPPALAPLPLPPSPPEDPKTKEDPRVLATARFVGKVSGFPEYRTLREDPGRFLVTKNPDAGIARACPPLRFLAVKRFS